MANNLYQVHMKNICAGLLTDDEGKVTITAPVLSWMRGEHIETIFAWVRDKGGKIFFVERNT